MSAATRSPLPLDWRDLASLGEQLVSATSLAIQRDRIIAMTSRRDSPLSEAADIALVLPPAAEACPMGLAPTTSTTMMLGLGDALAIALCHALCARSLRVQQPAPPRLAVPRAEIG